MKQQQQYLTTLAYFEPSPAEARALVKEAADLHATVDDAQSSWVDRTRSIERLKTVERLIQTSRTAKRQAEQHQVQQSQHAAAAAPKAEQQLYALPVAYFEREEEEEQGPVDQAQLALRHVETEQVENAGGRYVLSDGGGKAGGGDAYLWIPYEGAAAE